MSVKGPDGDLVSARVLPPNGLKTVYDALQAACEEAGVTFGVRGSGAFIYVETIGGFAEFDDGPLSGWIYKVNGVQVMQGIGSQTVSPGDRVSFYYTKDMGADVKSEP